VQSEYIPHDILSVNIYPIQMSYWAFTLTEVTLILASTLDVPPRADHIVTRVIGTYDSPERITVALISGTALVVAGAIIRFRCFREMGRHFTFALSLRDGHSLITTGPYSVVRHPAYTGGNMTLLGAALIHMWKGSWWFGGGYATAWGLILASHLTVSSGLIANGFLRGVKEDTYLKAQFGDHWERFAKQVPYRYIPGIC
jgi:protein-S-isoprenylcysteine O-methyltransferase Ste14